MSQWKLASREQCPVDFSQTISTEKTFSEQQAKFYNTESGDWVMVIGSKSLQSWNRTITDQLNKLEISWHQLGIVWPADKNTGPADEVLETLLQHCDLIAVPSNVQVSTQQMVSRGELSDLSVDEMADSYQLFQVRPTDANMLLHGAPLNVDVDEDLDAREKWFKDRH